MVAGDIDTSFKSAVSNMGKLEGTQDNMMLRLQFFELLVRLGQAKYKKTDRTSNVADALRMIITKDILPNAVDIVEEWDGFR